MAGNVGGVGKSAQWGSDLRHRRCCQKFWKKRMLGLREQLPDRRRIFWPSHLTPDVCILFEGPRPRFEIGPCAEKGAVFLASSRWLEGAPISAVEKICPCLFRFRAVTRRKRKPVESRVEYVCSCGHECHGTSGCSERLVETTSCPCTACLCHNCLAEKKNLVVTTKAVKVYGENPPEPRERRPEPTPAPPRAGEQRLLERGVP